MPMLRAFAVTGTAAPADMPQRWSYHPVKPYTERVKPNAYAKQSLLQALRQDVQQGQCIRCLHCDRGTWLPVNGRLLFVAAVHVFALCCGRKVCLASESCTTPTCVRRCKHGRSSRKQSPHNGDPWRTQDALRQACGNHMACHCSTSITAAAVAATLAAAAHVLRMLLASRSAGSTSYNSC
jgi:hypothetical protein